MRAIVITGAGTAFSSGHDLKELTAHRNDPDRGRAFFAKTMAACSDMMLTIVRSPKPVIAAVNGIATAAGCQLVASCDLAVASQDARFATPGVNIGLFCSTPMVALSRNVSRKAAMEMLLLGEMVGAEDAKSLGLVNRVVPPDRVVNEAVELGRQIALKPKRTLKIGKEAFYRQLEMPLEDAYAYACQGHGREHARRRGRGRHRRLHRQARSPTGRAERFAQTPPCPHFMPMNHEAYSDAYIRDILRADRTIAMVGASPNSSRPSYFAMKYLKQKGFTVIPVNPGQAGKEILGERVYASLADIKQPVDIVDIFRSSDAALGVTREAIRIGAKVVWMQLGVRNDEAARLAEDAGLKVVMNRCPKIEYGRLSGELGWAGVNSRMLSSRRPLLGPKGVQHRVLKAAGD